jgi:UrcA family protein
MKTLLITVALVATFAGTNPAAAEPARTAVVSTAGLDLSTAAGQRRLELRLLHAASDVCGTPSPADARGRTRYQECRTQVRANAAGQVRLLAERIGAVKVAAR